MPGVLPGCQIVILDPRGHEMQHFNFNFICLLLFSKRLDRVLSYGCADVEINGDSATQVLGADWSLGYLVLT